MIIRIIKEKFTEIVSYIWLAMGLIWDIWYHLVRGKIMLDSDMASEMIQADILNKEHAILCITKSWIYSNELRFLHMQWLYRLGLFFFPNNWHLARSFSMLIGLLLLAFSVWLVFYSIDRQKLGVWAAALSLFPGGAWYFWQTLYGAFFLPNILVSLFSVALSVLIVRKAGRGRRVLYLSLILILALGSGLTGVRQLMVFYSPWVISSLILFAMATRKKEEEMDCYIQSRGLFLVSFLSTMISVIGFIINDKVLSKEYAFRKYSDQEITAGSFFEHFKNFIHCFGFADERVLLSFQGITSVLGLVLGLGVILSGVVLLLRLGRLSFGEKILVVFSTTSIIMLSLVFSYVDGRIQYYQPIIPLGYFLIVICISNLELAYEKNRGIIMNLIMVVMLVVSAGTVYSETHEPIHKYRAHVTLAPIVDRLKEVGYTDGISVFWTSNIITELSDGAIDMWTRDPIDKEWISWQQRSDHMDSYPDGKYFFFFDKTREGEFVDEQMDAEIEFLNEHPELHPIYWDENYVIYGTGQEVMSAF